MARDLVFVALALFFWGVGEGAFIYFQPLYLQQMGASPLRIGAILGAAGVAMAIAHVPAGYLADRVGRRPLLWASWVLGMLAAWVMALGRSLPVFVGGLLLYSVTAFVSSPLNSYVTAARGRWSVGRAITLVSACYNTGAILGPLLGGVVGERLGLRQVYLGAAGLFLVSTLVILFIRPQPVETPAASGTGSGFPLTSSYFSYLGIVFLAIFATTLPQHLSSNFLQNERGLGLGQIGRLGSVASLGVVFLNLLLGQLEARLAFLLSQLAVGAFALCLWQGDSLTWFWIGYFLMGGYRTTRNFASAQTRGLVQAAHMGLAYGITETVSASAAILSAPLAGYIYEQSPVLVYPASLGLVLFSITIGSFFNPAGAAKRLALSDQPD